MRGKTPKLPYLPAGGISADWIEHNGSGCPIDPLSRPQVLLRAGVTVPMGEQAAERWIRQWTWNPQAPGQDDIIAYRREEDEFVAIPSLKGW